MSEPEETPSERAVRLGLDPEQVAGTPEWEATYGKRAGARRDPWTDLIDPNGVHRDGYR